MRDHHVYGANFHDDHDGHHHGHGFDDFDFHLLDIDLLYDHHHASANQLQRSSGSH
jgi:hypothetical protein